MTFDEVLKLVEHDDIGVVEKALFVSNRYYFEKLNIDSIEVAGVTFDKPLQPWGIRAWYKGVLEKISQLGDLYKDLFVCCSLEPFLFFRYASLSPHEIHLIVDGIKNAKKSSAK